MIEYFVFKFFGVDEATDRLNALAVEGWTLFSCHPDTYGNCAVMVKQTVTEEESPEEGQPEKQVVIRSR